MSKVGGAADGLRSHEGYAAPVRRGGDRNAAAPADTRLVRSVTRSLSILSAMGGSERTEWSLEEVSDAVGLPKSTTHRLLQTILSSGFVEYGTTPRGYRLALRAAVIGNASLRGRPLQGRACSVLRRLSAKTGQSAGFVVRSGDYAVTLHREFAQASKAHLSRRGLCPAHASAGGKVLLAALPEEEVRGIFSRRVNLTTYGPKTISTVSDLLCELDAVRVAGFAIDDEEYRQGLRCVGVPVRRGNGAVSQCIGLSAPSAMMTVEGLYAHVPLIEQAAEEISAWLDQ